MWGDMAERKHAPVSVRFGAFDVSLDTQELRKHGVRLKLSGQAIQVLLILLEIPGQLVTREELQQQLWPGASFGDFEHGLNAAVNRLREVLGDSATEPTYIETIPRRGYRFIALVEGVSGDSAESPRFVETLRRRGYRFVASVTSPKQDFDHRDLWFRRHKRLALGVALLSMLCAVAYVLNLQPTSREDLTIVRFTSYPGFESAPSFSPDGNEIVFSWYQDNEFSTAIGFDLYVKQFGNERAVRLTNHEANYIIPAWSPDGQNIAFTMIGKNGNGVYLMPALGGPE